VLGGGGIIFPLFCASSREKSSLLKEQSPTRYQGCIYWKISPLPRGKNIGQCHSGKNFEKGIRGTRKKGANLERKEKRGYIDKMKLEGKLNAGGAK
jgi:hypothetical protein